MVVGRGGGGLSYELIQDKMTAEINYFVKSNLWCVGCRERIEKMYLENEPCSLILHKKGDNCTLIDKEKYIIIIILFYLPYIS